MSDRIFTHRARLASAAAVAVAAGAAFAAPAHATNQGTADGNHTTGCQVSWDATTLMDRDGLNDGDGDGKPDVPESLMTTLDGTPTDYSNGGYVDEVSPRIGNAPGNFEIQHWTEKDRVNWRIFVATDQPMSGAKLTMSLPAVPGGGAYTAAATDWGSTYVKRIDGPWTTVNTPRSVTTTEVDLGDMPAMSHTMIMISAPLDPTTNAYLESYLAKAHVSGTYTPGAGCALPQPTQPTPAQPAPAPAQPEQPAPTTPAQPAPTEPATPAQPAPAKPAPAKPAPTKPVVVAPGTSAPRTVTRTFQIDRYLPRTAAQARVVARLDDDGRLGYREDRALWGASRHQFVTVTVPVNATNDQVAAAIDAATSSAVGDITTGAKLQRVTAGHGYTVAWELGRGASPKAAWGRNATISQVFFGRS